MAVVSTEEPGPASMSAAASSPSPSQPSSTAMESSDGLMMMDHPHEEQQQQQQQQHHNNQLSPSQNIITATIHNDATTSVPLPPRPRPVQSHPRNKDNKLILFTTPPRYSPFVWFLLAIPILVILLQIFLLHPRRDYRQSSTAWILFWTFLFVVVLYMIVLPKQIDVRSNGTVTIKTFLLTFHFDGIVRAYQAGIGREDFLRPRLKFATTVGIHPLDYFCGCFGRANNVRQSQQEDVVSGGEGTTFGESVEEGIGRLHGHERVVIRRNHGKWDVVVTPKDPDGFCRAVTQMVTMIEEQQPQVGSSGTPTLDGGDDTGGKPDLASTSAMPLGVPV